MHFLHISHVLGALVLRRAANHLTNIGAVGSFRNWPPRMVPLPSDCFRKGSLKRPVNPPGRALFLPASHTLNAKRLVGTRRLR